MILNLLTGLPNSLLIDLTMLMFLSTSIMEVGRRRRIDITSSNRLKVSLMALQSSLVREDELGELPKNFL